MTLNLFTAGSALVLLVASVTHPRSAKCPPGWALLTGIRESGRFACYPPAIGDDYRDARGIVHDDSYQPPGELDGQIYCTGGTRPIVVDYRTVGCQREGWE